MWNNAGEGESEITSNEARNILLSMIYSHAVTWLGVLRCHTREQMHSRQVESHWMIVLTMDYNNEICNFFYKKLLENLESMLRWTGTGD